MKKTILLLIAGLFSLPAFATHIAGGELFYRYVGDSTGIPRQYEVTLILYRDNTGGGGAGLPATAQICYTSSCNAGNSVTAARIVPPASLAAGDGGFLVPSLSECVDPLDPNFINLSLHKYRVWVILPVVCTDWKFFWASCCRNAVIDNLANASGEGFVIAADLNNFTSGENSSPRFNTPAVKAFCVNQTFQWSHASVEDDGDSLYYEFGQPLDGSSSACNTTSHNPISFTAGYSQVAPITSSTGVLLDSRNGTLVFTPSQIEVDVVKIDIREFRFDTVFNQWVQLGSITREMQISIVGNCLPSVQTWGTQSSIGSDTIYAQCGDKTITVNTSNSFVTSSLEPNGTDFAIINSQGTLLPIVGATTPGSFSSDQFTLHIHDSIPYSDTMMLVSRIGTDGNSLINNCGFELAGDTSIIISEGCSQISISEIKKSGFAVYPNPVYDLLRITPNGTQKNIELSILNTSGKQVLHQQYPQGTIEIKTTELPPGLYILRIEHDGYVETLKFVKA